MNHSIYLEESKMLDFSSETIKHMPEWKIWNKLNKTERAGAIYNFVRNDIAFGYNRSDLQPASEVLEDGYGQCNTKGTLFMALLRKAGIPCRYHGFTINKKLQRGAIPEAFYFLAPKSIVHSWVETYVDGKWINLEGFILDDPYLQSVQLMHADTKGEFFGYGIATKNLQNPGVNWCGKDTYIQKEGIDNDFGVFNTPDDFFERHEGNESGVKGWLYSNYLRHFFNRNLENIRSRRV
ncbi:transglutaminase [Alphaproteobacteria bacterium 46_93_T64]|nr:transglutaminase [Alphaproteobacteria bacterium 46_93_T64]